MANTAMLKAKGLYTFQNFLSSIPEGALLDATDVVIDRDGIIEPRRGIHQYGEFGTASSRAKQLLTYKNQILVHYGSTLAYDDGSGNITDFSGTFNEVDSDLRIKGVELNGNFYLTTSTGIRKIASTGNLSTAAITNAGGIKALDGTAALDYSQTGFFTPLSKVAYKMVWGTKDVNDNLILGAPSDRIVVTNQSSEKSCIVNLTFTIPESITTDYFYQIYRTAVSTAISTSTLADLDPGNEMYLIEETQITSAQISAKSFTMEDQVPETFRQNGTLLYTNPTSGEGILQSNYPPPVAKDIAIFKNSIFYANTKTNHRFNLNLLGTANFEYKDITNITASNPAQITSVGHGLSTGQYIAIGGVSPTSHAINNVYQITKIDNDTFSVPVDGTGITNDNGTFFTSYVDVTYDATTNRYFFVGRPTVIDLTFDTQGNTTDGSWFTLYSADDATKYYVWFDKTGSTSDPEPANHSIGIRVDISKLGTKEKTDFTFMSKTNVNNGGWFEIYSANDVTGYYIWMDKDGLGTDPAVVGKTGIRIPLADLDNATLITERVKSTVEAATTDFTITVKAGNILTFENTSGGTTTNPTAGTTTPGTGFVIDPKVAGDNNENVSSYVKTAIETATTDFAISQTTSSILTLITATNGAATNAAYGSPAPGGSFNIPTTQTQIGIGEDASKMYIKLSGYISAGAAVDETARSMVRVINKNASESIYGNYSSDDSDIPGSMDFESRQLEDIQFTFQANNADVGSLFNPDITTATSSSNEERGNRIYFSKYQQPEAVPIVNYIDIGPKDEPIQRIIPLRDSLIIFKRDGIYRLTGDVSPNFSFTLFDNSTNLVALDSAVVLNNQIFCLTDGGVSTVTETGIGVISRPIENVLFKIMTDNYPSLNTASFGVAYETDRSYLLWTVTNPSDTYATQCFRYNTFTQCWTRWDISHNCAILNKDKNKLYFGPTDLNYIEVERKLLLRTDYADRQYTLGINNNAISGNDLVISSVTNASEGDVLVQTQYVTINQFNSLLLKLDSDPRIGLMPGTFDTDYFSTLQMVAGDNLTNKLIQLVSKLNADPGVAGTYSFTGSTDFATIQTEFNTIINGLNADSLLKFTNYKTSTGTVNFEMTIISVNKNQTKVTGDSIPLFMVGVIVLYKGINVSVVWAPISGGDPTILKHFRESTMLFENSAFRGGTISFNSDLSPSFESIEFVMDGNGTWGGFAWGENTWGGLGTSVPMRTYVPRQKQRCRYIRSKFNHNDAFYKFSILGISYVFEVTSERAYRGT